MEKYQNIKILYEDNHLIVVIKPANMPVCKDSSNDPDLLTILKKYLKEKYNKPGQVFLGIVHRLDRPVEGIMVFAKTSKCAARLSKQINDKIFKKTYYSVVEGKPPKKGTMEDYIYKDNKSNKSFITNKEKGKLSILNYETIKTKNNLSLVKINLITGRHHQIRLQFSKRNYPLYADHKYNSHFINQSHENIALIAKKLSFNHPITKELLTFEIELPNKYPYNMF